MNTPRNAEDVRADAALSRLLSAMDAQDAEAFRDASFDLYRSIEDGGLPSASLLAGRITRFKTATGFEERPCNLIIMRELPGWGTTAHLLGPVDGACDEWDFSVYDSTGTMKWSERLRP